jgi:hypothetical protein
MRGIGEVARTNPQDACAGTSTVFAADSIPKNVAFRRLVTRTFTKGFVVIEAGGTQTFMPGGIGDGQTGIGFPSSDVGNVTCTKSDSELLTSPALLYPLNAAYWHGAFVDPDVQSKSVPWVNPPVVDVVPKETLFNISMTAAVQAASAALCACWRRNQTLP